MTIGRGLGWLICAAAIAAEPAKELMPLDWLTRGVWTAETKPAEGAAVKIESELRWMANQHAIQFVTRFNGEPHYSGIYGWDPGRKTIAFWYTSADGALTTGTAKPAAEGLLQEFDITEANGTSNHLRSEIRRKGGDEYDWNVQSNKSGEWKVLIQLHYTRR